MRLLFIDCFCPHGHINLNREYVLLFRKKGYAVDYLLKENYHNDIGADSGSVLWQAPAAWFDEKAGKIRARRHVWQYLQQVKKHANLALYDYIFVSSYEEMTLFFSGIHTPMILVQHANVAYLDSAVKRFFIKHLAVRSVFVVYHDFIKRRCSHFGIQNVHTEPMGLPPSYRLPASAGALLAQIDPALRGINLRHIVFAPSGSKYGDTFLSDLLGNRAFRQFLEDKGLALVVRDKKLEASHSNIFVVKRYISDDEYRSLFLQSLCILLCYPPSFTYRVSAVMNECFSNNHPCLLSDIEAFRAFEDHFNYPYLFSDAEGLMQRISALIEKKESGFSNWYEGVDSLKPQFDWLKS